MRKEQFGKVTIYQGDCMELMEGLIDKSFDLAVVDPPYRDENQPTKGMRANGSMKSLEGRPNADYFNSLYRVSKEQIIWGRIISNYHSSRDL